MRCILKVHGMLLYQDRQMYVFKIYVFRNTDVSAFSCWKIFPAGI